MNRSHKFVSAVVGLALVASFATASLAIAGPQRGGESKGMGRSADETSTTVTATTTPTLRFSPRTINLKSRGRWVEAKLNLGFGTSAASIDTSTVAITAVNGVTTTITPVKMRVSADTTTGPSFLIMKFARTALASMMVNGKNTVTVSGMLKDGTPFSVTDTVRANGAKKMHHHPAHHSKSKGHMGSKSHMANGRTGSSKAMGSGMRH